MVSGERVGGPEVLLGAVVTSWLGGRSMSMVLLFAGSSGWGFEKVGR